MSNTITVEFNREDLEKCCEFDCDNDKCDNERCKRTATKLIRCNLEYISTPFKIIKEQKR